MARLCAQPAQQAICHLLRVVLKLAVLRSRPVAGWAACGELPPQRDRPARSLVNPRTTCDRTKSATTSSSSMFSVEDGVLNNENGIRANHSSVAGTFRSLRTSPVSFAAARWGVRNSQHSCSTAAFFVSSRLTSSASK